MYKLRSGIAPYLSMVLLVPTLSTAVLASEVDELAEMPLEQLLDLEVVSASKYTQRQSDIPTTTYVIGADQIKGFGFRTVSEVLKSLPGLYVSNDGGYDNLGVRGMSGGSQFNGRVLVMIDGYRLNEAIYDSGTIGNELPLDVDLIDRIEVLRGPASSMYGSNAFFATINIITKSGGDIKGGQLAGAYGGFDNYKGRFSYGGQLDNGLKYLISSSGFDSAGPILDYSAFSSSENQYGRTHATGENNQQVFSKAEYGNWSLVGAWGQRNKQLSGSPFGVNFDDPLMAYRDTHAFVQSQYQTAISEHLDFTGRGWFGNYQFGGLYPYGDVHNIDTAQANWSGFELRLLSSYFDRQHITGGIEVQQNWQQQQVNYDQNPYTLYLNDNRDSHRIGIYLQDDISLIPSLSLSLGGRFDDYSLVQEKMFSPKAGLIWQAHANTTLKLLYGESFRAPNVWHQFYSYGAYFNDDGSIAAQGLLANPTLKPENAQTIQGTWEQKIADHWLARTTVYHIWMKNLFSQKTVDSIYFQNTNGDSQSAIGSEFEIERHWSNGSLVRASYSLQNAQNSQGRHLFDSPQHLFKLNLLAPLFHPDWQGGLEVFGMGPRHSSRASVSGYVVTNATLNWQLHKQCNLTASIYNLLDNDYLDPRGGPTLSPSFGRDFRLKVQFDF